MKKLTLFLILGFFVGGTSCGFAQSKNEGIDPSSKWIESQKLSYFLGRNADKLHHTDEITGDTKLSGNDYKDARLLSPLTEKPLHLQNSLRKFKWKANERDKIRLHRVSLLNGKKLYGSYEKGRFSEDRISEVIDVIKEVMEVTKDVQDWAEKLQLMKTNVGSKYELNIRSGFHYSGSGTSGLIEFELMKIL
jgi:hypothetical protein